jgi:hypothetical protein
MLVHMAFWIVGVVVFVVASVVLAWRRVRQGTLPEPMPGEDWDEEV